MSYNLANEIPQDVLKYGFRLGYFWLILNRIRKKHGKHRNPGT
jgi:hypothetical protein